MWLLGSRGHGSKSLSECHGRSDEWQNALGGPSGECLNLSQSATAVPTVALAATILLFVLSKSLSECHGRSDLEVKVRKLPWDSSLNLSQSATAVPTNLVEGDVNGHD